MVHLKKKIAPRTQSIHVDHCHLYITFIQQIALIVIMDLTVMSCAATIVEFRDRITGKCYGGCQAGWKEPKCLERKHFVVSAIAWN